MSESSQGVHLPDVTKKPTKKELLENKSNFIRIEISYSMSIVLPYKEAVVFMASLEMAEAYNNDIYDHPRISPMNKDNEKLSMSILSQEQYLKYKMNHLLDIT